MRNFIKLNWFKLGILVVICFVVVIFSHTNRYVAMQALVVINKSATSTSNVQTNKNNLQNLCEQKANNLLKSQPVSYSIQSHYSEELNRCFFVVQNESNDMTAMQFLYSEGGEEFGYYTKMIPTGDSMLCSPQVTNKTSLQPASAKLRCTSIATYADWQKFIKPYMEN